MRPKEKAGQESNLLAETWFFTENLGGSQVTNEQEEIVIITKAIADAFGNFDFVVNAFELTDEYGILRH